MGHTEQVLPDSPLPTDEEVEQGIRFRTYLNYLTCISDFLGDVYSDPARLVKPVIESRSFQSIQRRPCADTERPAKLFRNAWFTEIQMSISAQYEEFVSYSNHWIPVQAYYASYLALRGFFAASGQEVSREHSANLKAIGEEIQRRPSLFPWPWSVVCVGNPEDSSLQFRNLPNGVTILPISSLSASWRVEFWNSYALFLKTTRHRQLEKQCVDWKLDHRRKRVSSSVKQQFIRNLPPTTIFNCLYRLRLRSNYADADSFLLSVHESDEATSFHSSVRKIGWSTLLVLELLTARYLGKGEFESIVDSFRRYDTRNVSDDLIGVRWGTVRTLW
jgi:hypothetical protein